ncbi:putative CYC2-like cyclin putativeG1 cyclin CycE4 [Leptomonas pyrrhocoris]|uniref:Putative CYC2-like cyclin putativeG1 cyclin CycE4 n=1 Tax=Leptomonas pyrrhocoris TaxID=157538 RepID=A0A0N0VDV8_LEPPY|nr:putative CYC2-like cyclin putativeG1 cyclin CycE4 [Leptomonas pyrrhocoris]KPA76721.1 putative CYC2-like cyclin putativeG1 cyclin CycE4 [Leptomonas pyrrhocoris]|eukprot:XP_015655160.1 putative CYC2-like cyclin putativeG1 cyclin CycE4 [Leptomonas pyrrhocoris]
MSNRIVSREDQHQRRSSLERTSAQMKSDVRRHEADTHAHAAPAVSADSKCATEATTSIEPPGSSPHQHLDVALNSKEIASKAAPASVVTTNLPSSKYAKAAAAADDRDDCCDDDNDTDGFTTIGNGCGEAVSPPSSCADAFALDSSLAATTRPTEWSLRSFPVAPAASAPAAAAAGTGVEVLLSESKRVAAANVNTKGEAPSLCKAAAAVAAGTKPASFTAQAMQAIADTATSRATAPPPAAYTPAARKVLSGVVDHNAAGVASRVVAGEDPMGVRQLYSRPHSLVGSCLSTSSLSRRTAGTATADSASAAASPTKTCTDAFSMERFAVFYEVALEELMGECAQRVANAPAAWRDSQREFIRGDSNHDLATSTLSFDSPRSSGVSPVAGHASLFSTTAAGSNAPAYPPCFPNAAQNTHGLHTRELSGGLCPPTRAFPPPPSAPAPPSRSFFFSAAGQARHAELEKENATDETVPALLAALGRHHGKMAPMVFIAALAYLARVTVQCASELLSITHANWYRLTTTAILVAAKVYDEHSSARLNAHFATSSGIPRSEMTKLELDFLYLIDFDLLLKEAEVEQWLSWMETLATRRDLMTPLQSYFVRGVESHSTALASASSGTFSPASSSQFSGAPAESVEKRDSSADDTAAGVAAITSPLSIPASRAFPPMRLESSTALSSKDASADVAPLCHSTGVAEAPSAVFPLCEFGSPSVCSPGSFVAMPPSLLEAARSTLSGVSVAGSVSTSVSCLRATGVPPSPVHGMLPACPPPLRARLFSVVHGKREPPSPRSVRQLSCLGASPTNPPRPPPMEPNSPVGFFKQSQGGGQGYASHYAQRQNPNSATAAAAAGHGLFGADASNSQLATAPFLTNAFAGTAAGSSRSNGFSRSAQTTHASATAYAKRQPSTAEQHGASRCTGGTTASEGTMSAMGAVAAGHSLTSTTAPNTTAISTTTNASGSTRWGPFGMVQQVRDVLGVTASLVRGQLNVLAPAKAPEELKRPQSRTVVNEGALHNTAGRGGQAGMRAATGLHDCSSNAPYRASHTYGVDKVSGNHNSRSSTRRKPAPAELTAVAPSSQPLSSPVHHGRWHRAASSGQSSSHDETRSPGARHPAVKHADPHDSTNTYAQAGSDGGAEEAYGYYYEEREYDEEDEYGYYGEDGYYYAYDDEEGYEDEEGEYYYADGEAEEGWYEAEAEDEYFQRCRPPLTHSPPSL